MTSPGPCPAISNRTPALIGARSAPIRCGRQKRRGYVKPGLRSLNLGGNNAVSPARPQKRGASWPFGPVNGRGLFQSRPARRQGSTATRATRPTRDDTGSGCISEIQLAGTFARERTTATDNLNYVTSISGWMTGNFGKPARCRFDYLERGDI